MPKKYVYTEIDDQKIRLSSLDKILYPNLGITKAEVIEYYLNISDDFLRFNANRPQTLIRFPNGIHKNSFYAKEAPEWKPDWLRTQEIKHSEESIHYPVIQNTADLIWLANLSALEFHPMQMNIEKMNQPEFMVFDLDPDPQQDFKDLVALTQELKQFLEDKQFKVFIKTSGGKGLHLFLPIKPNVTHEYMFNYVKKLAAEFVKLFPKRTTLNLSKDKRNSRVLIDVFRNHRSHSTVAPFSLRGKLGAPVSFPFHWELLNDLPSSQFFTLRNFKEQYQDHKEAWSGFYEDAIDISLKDFKSEMPIASKDRSSNVSLSMMKSVHMLAGVTKEISSDKEFIYEVKWDGIRVFLIKENDSLRVISRSGRDITQSFPELVNDGLNSIPSSHAIIDAELVCLDETGKPIFADVISRLHSKKKLGHQKPCVAYLFDCVAWDGERITGLDLVERYKKLEKIKLDSPHLRLSQHFEEGQALLDAAETMGLEGIMLKKKSSKYHEGQRSNDWLKLKFRSTMTCTIIGFTEGKGDRKDLFGSLHLVTKDADKYVYRGRVGTGFDKTKMKNVLILLKKLVVDQKPIRLKVEEEMRTTWIEPLVQCEIQYASLTANDTLREPVFLHLREDLASQ